MLTVDLQNFPTNDDLHAFDFQRGEPVKMLTGMQQETFNGVHGGPTPAENA